MFADKKFLVTAGPTYEPIDPVRYIGNRSSGKMGFHIAEELAKLNATVYLVTGPTNLTTIHKNIQRIDVETAEQMYNQVVDIFPGCDVAIMSAAVADYTPVESRSLKIKKEQDEIILKLKKTRDILAYLGKIKKENQVLVGFSLETHDELKNAIKKLQRKNLDFIVLNSLKNKGAGFEVDTNKITIIDRNEKVYNYSLKNKREVAIDIIDFLKGYIVD